LPVVLLFSLATFRGKYTRIGLESKQVNVHPRVLSVLSYPNVTVCSMLLQHNVPAALC